MSRQHPHVLFIAFPFPPSRGAGVYRSVAMTNYLVESGWRVTVVAPEEDYFIRYQGTEDRSLLAWVDERAEVVRVPVTNWLRESNVARMSWVQTFSPRLFKKVTRSASRYLSPLDHYPFWLRPATQAGRRVARRRGVDLVLATGNPFNSFVAAALVGRSASVPYVLDYRDTWTLDQFTGDIKPLATDVALPLERRLLHGAGAFISVNRPILDWLSTQHAVPPRVRREVIPNGYDPEFIGSTDPGGNGRKAVRYVHVGTLVPQKMDWRRMISQFDETARRATEPVTLDVYGHLGFSARPEQELRAVFDEAEYVSYQGPVARAEVMSIYDTADVLYLPLYESPYVTSGKVYEMMATQKPILAWGPETAGALEPLRGYPKLVRADPSRPITLARAMAAANRISTLGSDELEARTNSYVARFSRTSALEALDPLLRQVAGR